MPKDRSELLDLIAEEMESDNIFGVSASMVLDAIEGDGARIVVPVCLTKEMLKAGLDELTGSEIDPDDRIQVVIDLFQQMLAASSFRKQG